MPDKINTADFGLMIHEERKYQADRWADGTEDGLDKIDDDKNEATDFVAHIAHHSSRWFPGGFPPYGRGVLADFKAQMVKVAALAFAAYKWADRRMIDIDDAEAALQRGVSEDTDGDEAA